MVRHLLELRCVRIAKMVKTGQECMLETGVKSGKRGKSGQRGKKWPRGEMANGEEVAKEEKWLRGKNWPGWRGGKGPEPVFPRAKKGLGQSFPGKNCPGKK